MIEKLFFSACRGFFHDEIDFPEGGNDISDKTVWKLAYKQILGDSRTMARSAKLSKRVILGFCFYISFDTKFRTR